MMETKEAERQCLQSIQGNYGRHHHQVFRMGCISEVIRNGCDEAEDKQKEESGKASHHRKAGREDGIGLLAFIIGESEERRLHAESQDGAHQSGVCIHVRVHTLVARSLGHVVRVERNEQVIEETTHDAREPIDSRILC